MYKYKTIAVFSLVIIFISIIISSFFLFGAPQKIAETENFIIALKITDQQIIEKLKIEGFIKSELGFNIVLFLKNQFNKTKAGGYTISKSMSVWQIANIFNQKPYLRWINIPEGYRKEQIAEILNRTLEWTAEQKKNWISYDTTINPEYTEGVYFPDTYLIPADEKPLQVAERLQAKFQEKFAPLAKEAIKQNIKWTTALKIASLIQRESGGKNDMALISGIIWNRLLQNMKLDIDATIQYARGNTGEGWWAPLTSQDKQIDSPYNTYKHSGLPPHPISNPGLDAIQAALFPQKTDCLYYLHDNSKIIHCAKSYKEHLQNIDKYLR